MDTQEKKTKKKPTKIEDMTREQIRQTLLKKRECNAKAQSIVESLLEEGVTESYFIQCLPDINQSHLEDIIEERSITKLCGYPLCSRTISENDIPKQKYRISMKTNKVYDITTRKSFCSNTCYESAMYVKRQMLSSPLWYREYEEIPEFQLLPLNSMGSMGREVDLSIIVKLNVKNEQQFASINDFTSASLNELPPNSDIKLNIDNVNSPEENNSTGGSNEPQHASKDNNSHNVSDGKSELPVQHNNCSLTEKSLEDPNSKQMEKKHASNPLNIVGDIVEKPQRSIDPILSKRPDSTNITVESKSTREITKKKQHSVTAVIVEVEKCLAEWLTLDTLLYLFGEDKVKEMVADKGDCIKEYLNNYANGLFYSANSYDQYQILCRKLNMLELEDRRYDYSHKQNTKPLPDYSILQEESKKMHLKVKAFLAGEMDIVESNTTAKELEQTSTDNSNLTQLPLVDKNAQRFLRRKIVCQHLNKVLPDLLRSLGLLTLSISSDVRLLVNTFKLQANNIMFKPIQWTLIAMVIIKLLSIRDKRLEYLLERKTAYEHMQLLLLSYKQDGGYLDRLTSWLTDVDRLLDVNDTQLTIQ